MKRMDLFCASPASTAICSSIDHRSMIRRGHSPVDHHHHHHHHRHNHKPYAPCSSKLPIVPKPYNNNLDNQKSTGKSSADHISNPHGSSRYLLSDRPFIDWVSESDHHRAPALVRSVSAKPKLVSSNDSPSLQSSSSKSRHKVVVLRVSIHCKGCEGKLRKHISKMEGVTSFSIDLATKKVTIIGDLTPLSVLASVSRVKNAQFWPSSSSPPPVMDMISY